MRNLTIRPLTRDDGAALDAVFAGLSSRSRFLRFHSPVPRLTPRVRAALLDVDGRDRVALVAELPDHGGRQPVGIARFVRTGAHEAELALAVVDACQRKGVGRRLLDALGDRAEQLGFTVLFGLVLPENTAAVRLLRAVFPGSEPRWDDGVVRVDCPLGVPEIGHDDLLSALAA